MASKTAQKFDVGDTIRIPAGVEVLTLEGKTIVGRDTFPRQKTAKIQAIKKVGRGVRAVLSGGKEVRLSEVELV